MTWNATSPLLAMWHSAKCPSVTRFFSSGSAIQPAWHPSTYFSHGVATGSTALSRSTTCMSPRLFSAFGDRLGFGFTLGLDDGDVPSEPSCDPEPAPVPVPVVAPADRPMSNQLRMRV